MVAVAQSKPVAGARLDYEPALDGLRGLAVLAVLAYHGAAANRIDWLEPWTRGGFLGVSAFFTLSGFLICSLLLAEHRRTGSVSLRRFWARRFRRLMPASLALIAAVVALTPVLGTASQLEGLRGDVWASLADVANWRFILQGSDYATQFSGAPSPLKHLWSLSIEEQWYLVIPLVTAGLLAWGRRRVGSERGTHPPRSNHSSEDANRRSSARLRLLVFFSVAVVASVAMTVLLGGGEYSNRVYMGTGTRLAEMAVGAALAVVLAGRFRLSGRAHTAVVAAGPVLLAALVALWARTPIEASWLYRGGLALHAAMVAVVILAAVQTDGPVRRVLSWRPLVGLGLISYAVYLYHWPLMWWITPARLGGSGLGALAVQLLVTVALAVASFLYLERPIRSGLSIVSWRRTVVPIGAVGLIALAAATLPDPDPKDLLALGDNPRLTVATTTSTTVAPAPPADASATVAPPSTAPPPPPPPLEVMVVGDSFAESIAVGLQQWGVSTGHMSVLDASIPACSFGRGGRNDGVNITRPLPPECVARDKTMMADLASFTPDVVLVAGGLWDVTDRQLPGSSRWTRIGEPAYDDYLRAELDHLMRLASGTGALVVWANSPHWSPVPDSVVYMGDPPYSEAQPGRVERFNQVLSEAAAARPEVRILDLAGWMQSQPGGELAPDLRPDGVHFSQASTLRVAEWLGPELLRLGRSPDR